MDIIISLLSIEKNDNIIELANDFKIYGVDILVKPISTFTNLGLKFMKLEVLRGIPLVSFTKYLKWW